ncbi:MAG: transcriptional regulator MraZ [Chthoniobacter sp.]|jgi:MraZ protein|nr:transcriptional regulator MraZ [Chthoniobacter sp.]
MAKPTSSAPIFSGEFRHSLDDKNRLTIPAQWRSEIAAFYVIKNPKRACLTVMPPEVFGNIGAQAKENATAAQHRIFMTNFYAQSKNCAIDKQGRLLLRDDHCKAAGLENEIVLTGSLDRFELWTPASWQSYQDEHKRTFEDVAEAAGL